MLPVRNLVFLCLACSAAVTLLPHGASAQSLQQQAMSAAQAHRGFNWFDGIGYLGALVTLGTYSMKRMIPLRICGICANCLFIVYGLLAPVYPQLILHSILLPLNAFRLREMLRLVSQVKTASQGDLSMEWLKPYMSRRSIKQGEVLFRKGDLSTAMFYTISGRYRLNEIGKEIGPGQIIGEIGLISPDMKRTLTFEAIEDGVLLTISYAEVKQLYYQNQQFGFYLLRLIGERLLENVDTQAIVKPA